MRSSCVCFVAGFLLCFAATRGRLAMGQNLVRNPGFEQGQWPYCPGMPTYWEPNDAICHPDIHVLDSSIKHAGQYSLHLKASPVWDLGMTRQVTNYGSITPGRQYRIEAWVRTANVQNPAGWYVFGIAWFRDDTWLTDVKMPQQETLNYDWRLISYVATAPSYANRVAVLLTRHTDGDAWYDDVSVTEVAPGPIIERSPASFTRTVTERSNLPNDTFTVRNSGIGTLSYSITEAAAWFDVSPTTGTSTGETDSITITYNTAALAPGPYSAQITISDTAGSASPQTISVSLTVEQWYAPADYDRDQDVDLQDFSVFQSCFNGPNRAPPFPECTSSDFDDDGDVDLTDFSAFQACFNGPNRPPACL